MLSPKAKNKGEIKAAAGSRGHIAMVTEYGLREAVLSSPKAKAAAAAMSPTAAPSRMTRWSSLYRDALGCIAQFLTLNEFLAASRCCHSWHARILGEGSAPHHFGLQLHSADSIIRLSESPIRRHTRLIEFVNDVPLAHSDFYLLALNLPQLRSLSGTIDISLQPCFPRRYPRSLTALSLTCCCFCDRELTEEEAWQRVYDVMDEIGQISTLTEIRVFIDYEDNQEEMYRMTNPPSEILTPLLRLKDQLRVLHFRSDGIQWTRNHIEVMRQFHQLEDLDFVRLGGNPELLEWYTADPVPPRIKSLQIWDCIRPSYVPFLSRLSSLTRFDATIDLVDMSFLASFPLLEELYLQPYKLYDRPSLDGLSLINAVSKLTHLHSLSLGSPWMKSDGLCSLLAVTHHLHTLILDDVSRVTSLEFTTRVPHLQQTLETLVLSECKQLISELHQLSHLRALRRLELNRMFDSMNPQSLPSKEIIQAFSLRITRQWAEEEGGRIDYAGTGARNGSIMLALTPPAAASSSTKQEQQVDSRMSDTSSKARESKKRKFESNSNDTPDGKEKKVKEEHKDGSHLLSHFDPYSSPITPLDAPMESKGNGNHDGSANANTTPPAARLVGIELNPGPATTMILMSTVDSRWSSLYRDALGCIAQFLTLNEFLTVSQCCRKWNAQIFGEESTPQQLLLCLKSPGWIVNLIESPLRRHVRTIKVIDPMAHNDFYLITTHCPQIRSLDSTLNFSQEYPFPHRYPHSLTAITLTCEFSYADGFRPHEAWKHMHEVIDEISQIPNLTEIRIEIIYRLDTMEEEDVMKQPPDNLLQPLFRLADQLRVFHFSSRGTMLTRNFIEMVRAFHQLENLNINIGDTELLQWYTADPAPSRVKVINLCHQAVKPEYLPYLARLPSLTRLGKAIGLTCEDFPILSNFPLLEDLTLSESFLGGVNYSSLTNAISKLISLHTLTLRMPRLNADQLCLILSATPHLHTLTLSYLDQLESLSFTTHVPHLQKTLESLTLFGCDYVCSTVELLRLSYLRALRRLELQEMFSLPKAMPSHQLIATFSLRVSQQQKNGRIDYAGTGAKEPIDIVVEDPPQKEESSSSSSAGKRKIKKRKNDLKQRDANVKEKKVKHEHDDDHRNR